MVNRQTLGACCVAIASLVVGCGWGMVWPAPGAAAVKVTTYGHGAVLFESDDRRLLINPFQAVACTADLKEPRLDVDVILASSLLLDEGAPVARGTFLSTPGSYVLNDDWRVEGFAVPHDKVNGRRFGKGVVWIWEQAGLRIVNMGGAAVPPTPEERILLSGADVLVLAVGGGSKVLDGVQAAQVVNSLKPRLVIPVQYTSPIPPEDCDLTTLEPFLDALPGTIPVVRQGPTMELSAPMVEGGTTIHVLGLESR